MSLRTLKIELHFMWARDMIEIIPVRDSDDFSSTEIGIIKSGEWKLVRVDRGRTFPKEVENGILRIPTKWAKELQVELERLFGHPKAPATEQALTATMYHLEDMRRLVFGKRSK